MNKLIKCVLVATAVLLLVVVGAGVYLSRNLPQIIKNSVETYGPKATGTAVKLGGIQIIYGTGRVELKDLVIANPPNFKSAHAFSLNNLVLQIDPFSIFDPVIVINKLSVSRANIIAEQSGTSLKTNLQKIVDHVDEQSRRANKSTSTKAKPAKTQQGAVKLIVEEFKLTDNSIDLISEAWGNRKITMPDMTFKNIGKKEGGLTPDQLTQRIMELLTDQASKAARDELEEIAKEKAKDKLSSKIKERWNSLFD